MKLVVAGLMLAVVGVGATLLLTDDDGSSLSTQEAEGFGKRIARQCQAPPGDVARVRCELSGGLWRCAVTGVNEGTVTFPDEDHPEVSVIC